MTNKDYTPDPYTCPRCGGEADNGHDRCLPPNPYVCIRCMQTEEITILKIQLAERDAEIERLKEAASFNDFGMDFSGGRLFECNNCGVITTLPWQKQPQHEEPKP